MGTLKKGDPVKKNAVNVMVAVCVALGLGACSSAGTSQNGAMVEGAPFWMNHGTAFKDKDGFIYMRGSYDGSEDLSVDQDAATDAAVAALAEFMSEKILEIKGLEKENYGVDNQTPNAKSRTLNHYGKHVLLQVKNTVHGAAPVDQFVDHKTHTVWVLVRMKWSQAQDAVGQDGALPPALLKETKKELKNDFENLTDETKQLKKLNN